MRKRSPNAVATALVVACASCGGSGPEPSTPEASEPAPGEHRSSRREDREESGEPTVTAEIGGLPPEQVEETFMKAEDRISRCFNRGLERVEFMGGAVKFWVKVDGKGKFLHAHLEHSDLGDRKTEQCFLDQLMSYTWPTPVGGKLGIATFSMSFDPSPDAPQPKPWSADRVRELTSRIATDIDDCKSGLPGTFRATVYVVRGAALADAGASTPVGAALSASVTPPNEAAEMAIDCMVGVLGKAEYPDPGPDPAKVSFPL